MSNEPPTSTIAGATTSATPSTTPNATPNAKGDPNQADHLSEDGINIAHLQRLARLALEPAQAEAAKADLQNIVAMIDAMQAIPTDSVEPLTHPLETPARLRPDRVTEVVDREVFQSVGPATDAGFYLVPKVIE